LKKPSASGWRASCICQPENTETLQGNRQPHTIAKMLIEATKHELEKKLAEVEAQAVCGGSRNWRETCMDGVTEPKISLLTWTGCCSVDPYAGSMGASTILREKWWGNPEMASLGKGGLGPPPPKKRVGDEEAKNVLLPSFPSPCYTLIMLTKRFNENLNTKQWIGSNHASWPLTLGHQFNRQA
jgi:hypothetical protein